MVIAVMGGTFERVAENTDSYIMKEKLALIMNNFHRFPDYLLDRLKAHKYLLSVEVDPEVDPIEPESMEKRLNENIQGLKERMTVQEEGMNRINLNLDTLYDRLCSDEKNTIKKKPTLDDLSDDEFNKEFQFPVTPRERNQLVDSTKRM